MARNWWESSRLADDEEKWWESSALAEAPASRDAGGGRGFVNPPMVYEPQPVRATPTPTPAPAASAPLIGNAMGDDFASAIMAEAAAAPAPAQPPAPKLPPYKDRRQALDDAVNLVEEGAPLARVAQSFSQIGIDEGDIIAHGVGRKSPMFQAPEMSRRQIEQYVKPEAKPIPQGTGEIKPIETSLAEDAINLGKRVGARTRQSATNTLFQLGAIGQDDAARLFAQDQRKVEAAAPPESVQEGLRQFGEAKTFTDAAVALATNPKATFVALAESLLQTAPAMALAVGRIPALARATGIGVTSGALEFGSAMADVLGDKGVDLTNAAAISEALNKSEIKDEIREKGAKRGLTIATIDALTAGFAGKFLAPVQQAIYAGKMTEQAAKRATLGAWSKELGMQVAGGSGGEALAQQLTGEFKPTDILLEGLGEGLTAPLEARGNVRESKALLPEAQIAREIDAAGQAFDQVGPAGSQAVAIDMLRTEPGTSNLISPAATVANFTPPESPTKQAGLVDIEVPLPGAETAAPLGSINPTTEQQFGLDKLRMGGANVGTTGAPGELAGAGGVGGSGVLGGGLDAAGRGAGDTTGDAGGTAGGVRVDGQPPVPPGGAAGEQPAGVTPPSKIWAGRAGDGYVQPADAQQALPKLQSRYPNLTWNLQKDSDGKFFWAGTTRSADAGAQAGTTQPAAGGEAVAGAAAPGAAATAAPAVQTQLSDTERAGLKLALPAPAPTFAKIQEQIASRVGVTVEAVPAAEMTDTQRVASAVARLMGNTLTVVRATAGNTASMPNAFIERLGGKHIFIDEKADDAPLFLAVHEGLHSLPAQRRKALNAGLLELFNQDQKGEFLREFKYSPDKFDEEAPAMMAQAISKRADFWEQLRDKMGNKEFGEVAKVILTKLNELITGARKQYGDDFVSKYITNVEKARDLLTTAYAESMQAQGLKPDVALAGEALAASERAVQVNRLDMNFKDVTKRVPELTAAAQGVAAGTVTKENYDRLVNEVKPVRPYDFVPAPATQEDAERALTSSKLPRYGIAATELKSGERVGLRLDIPAYQNHGVWVNSIHPADKSKKTLYGNVSAVTNATFDMTPREQEKALDIARGESSKSPFARIEGQWKQLSEKEAVTAAQSALKSKDWVQVGMDPERHSYFYDRTTMQPVLKADEVIQIGPLVLAKNPTYGEKSDFMFSQRADGARQISSENLEPLSIDKSAPAKDKPAVLVFGGTFNPVHEGHVEAALKARELMRRAGYQVEDLVIAPSPQSLMKAKSREDAVSLTDRVAMLREAVKNEHGVTVTDRPSRIADRWSGKISRTAAMDWAQEQHPGKHVVMVAGDDTAPADAPPPGAGGTLYTSNAKGMEGRSYVVMPREAAGDNRSSSMLRKLISKNEAVPETLATPGVVRYYQALSGKSQEVAIDGVLRDMNADNFGLPDKPVTLADSDPLLRPTIDLNSVQWQGRQVPREVMRGEVVADVLRNGKKPAGKPIVYLMGGGGAAGKGTIKAELKAQGAISYDAVDIDPDEIKAMIPEYGQIVEAGDWRAASVVHQESTKIADQVLDKALASGYSIVLDKTMGSPSKGVDMINRFKSMGYEVRLFGVTVDPRFAIYRATSRALKTGRWVPTRDMLKAHRNFTPAFEAFANAADQAVLFENTDGPELLAVKTSDVLIINDKVGYNKAVERSENVDVNARTLAEVSGGSLAADRSSERSTGRPEVRSSTRSDQSQEQGRSNTGRASGDQGSAVEDREEAGGAAPLDSEGPEFSKRVGEFTYTKDDKRRITVSGDAQRIRFLTKKVANSVVTDAGVRFKNQDAAAVLKILKGAPKVDSSIGSEVASKLSLTPQELASTSLEYQTGLPKDRAFVAPIKVGIPEVVQFLEQRRRASGLKLLDIAKPEDQRILAKLIAAETLAAIRSSGNALQWYDETIARTLAMAAVKYPELGTDRNAQMVFRVAMAITSQGMNVEDNLKFTMDQYDAFRKSAGPNGVGKFPEVGKGEDLQAMAKNFKLVNEMLAEMGPDTLRRFLITPFTVGELRSAGFEPEGELIDELVLGSSVLGPKIGFGFYSNLNGNFEPVTMDMWFMRTIGRLTGHLRSFDAEKFSNQLKRFRSSLDERGTNGVFADSFDQTLVERARTDEGAAIELARQVKKAHEKDFKDNRQAFDAGTREKSQLVYAADTMITSLDKPKDVPGNGSERRQMREVVRQAVALVEQAYGQRIPPAAMQALIWYPEQELYKAMGVKLRVTSQDYAGATKKVLTEEGYDAKRLSDAAESGSRGAQQKARQDVGRGDQAAGSTAGQAGPLEGAEREQFIRTRYERNELAKEQAQPKRRGIIFEVAPDPNNEQLTAAWRNLSAEQRLAISERVAREIVPRVLKQFDTDGIITAQVGSYLDDTNPSFNLLLNKGDAIEIAKALGFVLAQDSMMVISPRELKGGDQVGAIFVKVGDKSSGEINEVYQKLREIRVNGEQPIGGQSYANGRMIILNYSGVSTDQLAILVDQKLNKAYSVETGDVYSAFPEKKEYDYGSEKTDPRGSRGDLRRGARGLRAEATAALERELGDAGIQFSSRSNAEKTEPVFSTRSQRQLPAVSPQSALNRDIRDAAERLRNGVAAVRAGQFVPKIMLGRLPHVLNMLGARTQDFDIATSIVSKVFDWKHGHEFPDIKPIDFMRAVYRPALVFQSKDSDNEPVFELVLPITNEAGAMLVPIKYSIEAKKDPFGAVKSVYNRRISNDPKKPNEMTIVRRIQKGNLLYVDPMLAKEAMTGRPRGGLKDGVKLNDKFLSWPGVWPTIEKLIQDRRVKTDVDLMEWIGENYNPEGAPQDMADAPAFSTRAATPELDKDVVALFKDLQDSRGLGRIRAQERVDAHPMAATITKIDSEFLDILDRLDSSGLIKINCK